MGRNIISVTESRRKAQGIAGRINKDFSRRKIDREARVCPVSQSFVRKLTRPGFPIPRKNFGVCVRNKR